MILSNPIIQISLELGVHKYFLSNAYLTSQRRFLKYCSLTIKNH